MPDPQTTHSDRKPPATNRTISRSIAVSAFVAGLVLLVWGWTLETQNPRTNAEDDFAWLILGVGVSLSAFAIALWFVRPRIALIAAIVAPPLAFSRFGAGHCVCDRPGPWEPSSSVFCREWGFSNYTRPANG